MTKTSCLLLAVVSLAVSARAGINFQHARACPEWLTKGVMYQIQPRAFTAEGTLKAAEAKSEELSDRVPLHPGCRLHGYGSVFGIAEKVILFC